MNEMQFAKVLGSFCVAGLAYVLPVNIAGAIYGMKQLETPAYAVEIEEAGAGGEEEEATPLAQLLAEADAADGEKVFKKCASCHAVDSDKVGPHLGGVMGREIGSVAGFGYSEALTGMAGRHWGWEEMNAFLAKPKDFAPGTKMSFAGLRKESDRAALLLWLNAQGGALELPTE